MILKAAQIISGDANNLYLFTTQKSTHSTPRSKARGMLSLPAGRQGLILSGAFNPDLKIGFGAVERINSSAPSGPKAGV